MANTESLTLKWGTLKRWRFNPKGPAMAALEEYANAGPISLAAMDQRDNQAQKEALCKIIDAVDADIVHNDWNGKEMTKEEAKEYVRSRLIKNHEPYRRNSV